MADTKTQQPARPTSHPEPAGDHPEIAQQIEKAMLRGSKQINVDTIAKHLRGKQVWVLDREKMQAGIMRVVDQAIYKSQQEAEGVLKTRQRVATAITNLFGNKKNLTSPVDAASVARQTAARPQPGATQPGAASGDLGSQIARLENLINRAERVLMRGGWSSGPGASGQNRFVRQGPATPPNPQQEKVLIQILEDNLELIRGMNEQPSASSSGDYFGDYSDE